MRNRLYTGTYEWNGNLHQGLHTPLIPHALWEAAQAVLDGRSAANLRARPKDFAYTGLMTCGHCGCAIVGEIKKGRYIYYHCSKAKGRCPEPYVRQEALDDHFAASLKRIRLDPAIFALIQKALKESHVDEQRERDEQRRRLMIEADALQSRMDVIYLDKVDGRISADYHDRIVKPWREERARVIRDLEHLNSVDEAYSDDGVALLEVATNAHKAFASMAPHHKRRALKLVASNWSWANGRLETVLRQPFDMIADFGKSTHANPATKRPHNGQSDDLVTPTGIEPVFQP